MTVSKQVVETLSKSVLKNASDAAWRELREDARANKQSVQTVVRRMVSNMLRYGRVSAERY